jgi:hypothetical protein
MVKWILGPLPILTYLLVVAVVFKTPLVILCLLAPRWLAPLVVRMLIAIGFAAASGCVIWRIEWFDLWRQGMPPVGYLLTVYAPYVAVYGGIGWFIGSRIAPGRGFSQISI